MSLSDDGWGIYIGGAPVLGLGLYKEHRQGGFAMADVTGSTGRHTAVPSDGRCFIEEDGEGRWHVYKTGGDGRLVAGFPKETEESFGSVGAAQAWATANVEPHHVESDALAKAVAAGGIKFASTQRVEDWRPWVDEVFSRLGIEVLFVSDEAVMGDYVEPGGEASAMAAVGVPFDVWEPVWVVAEKLSQAG